MKIQQVDKNFLVNTNITQPDIVWYNVRELPFEIKGLIYDDTIGRFLRMPQSIAKNISEGVEILNTNTSGGRVRFKTDSSYIAIHTVMDDSCIMPHMPLTGQAGFDIYRMTDGRETYFRTFIPPAKWTDGYSSGTKTFGEFTDYTINFPLYHGVKELYIGLKKDAVLEAPEPYKNNVPVVFYGNSITQGGCASRPGMAYESIISREIGCDYINLGFSGNAKGEYAIAKHIASMDMSLFVYDYDYNAPSIEHLENTHQAMFEIIRKNNLELPILMLSRPKYKLNEEEEKRFNIIKQTYDNAIDNGDKNVYLLKGTDLMKMAKSDGTVDNCHPTDFGFSSMANAIIPVIREILQKGE